MSKSAEHGRKGRHDPDWVFPAEHLGPRQREIAANLTRILVDRADLGDYALFAHSARVFLRRGDLMIYPDIVITKGRPTFSDRHTNAILNPHWMFKVFDTPFKDDERWEKKEKYELAKSVRGWVFLWDTEPMVERYDILDRAMIEITPSRGFRDYLRLDELNLEVPLRDIYEGVRLDQEYEWHRADASFYVESDENDPYT